MQLDARPLAYFIRSLDSLYPHLALQSQGRDSPAHFFNPQTVASSGVEGSRWHTAVGTSARIRRRHKGQLKSQWPPWRHVSKDLGVALTLYPDPILDRLHVSLSFPRLLSIPASTGLDGDDFVSGQAAVSQMCVFSRDGHIQTEELW